MGATDRRGDHTAHGHTGAANQHGDGPEASTEPTDAPEVVRLDPQHVSWHRVGDEIVALAIPTGTYFTTNGAGAVLWERLAEGASPQELAEVLVACFGIDHAQATGDVLAFLDDLRTRALLVSDA